MVFFGRMAGGEDDVEHEEQNILYDLTIQAEWPQESEVFVCISCFVFKVFLFFEIHLHEINDERGVVTATVSDCLNTKLSKALFFIVDA